MGQQGRLEAFTRTVGDFPANFRQYFVVMHAICAKVAAGAETNGSLCHAQPLAASMEVILKHEGRIQHVDLTGSSLPDLLFLFLRTFSLEEGEGKEANGESEMLVNGRSLTSLSDLTPRCIVELRRSAWGSEASEKARLGEGGAASRAPPPAGGAVILVIPAVCDERGGGEVEGREAAPGVLYAGRKIRRMLEWKGMRTSLPPCLPAPYTQAGADTSPPDAMVVRVAGQSVTASRLAALTRQAATWLPSVALVAIVDCSDTPAPSLLPALRAAVSDWPSCTCAYWARDSISGRVTSTGFEAAGSLGALLGSLLDAGLVGWADKRPIYLSRHGQSEYNIDNRIGGDSNLTAYGNEYAAALGVWGRDAEAQLKHKYPKAPLTVWTSGLNRAIQSVSQVPVPAADMVYIYALNELNAGAMDGLTYADIESMHSEEFRMRQKDKFTYRYPQGESYADLVARLLPVLQQLEQQTTPTLVLAHQAVLRCIYSYFCDIPLDELPFVAIPSHTVITLTEEPDRCTEIRQKLTA